MTRAMALQQSADQELPQITQTSQIEQRGRVTSQDSLYQQQEFASS